MSYVELTNVDKYFGQFQAIDEVSLSIEKGEFCALLGPSGCGKSTLLRMIAGLELVSGGSISINGVDVTTMPPAKRRIAMVFQSYALYPHMSVRQNISFGLEIAKMPKAEVAAQVDSVARMLQLENLLDRRPAQLSGGQRQRVAIGRALVRDPQVFLFDEPLSNLDAMLRVQMRVELANLHQELQSTMIYVTHDQVEAMTLADRIAVLDNGRISQIGTPLDLYHKPENKFVASFIGSPAMNFIDVETVGNQGPESELKFSGNGSIKVKKRNPASTGTAVEVGVRPEHIRIGDPGSETGFAGHVALVEHLGNATVVHTQTDFGTLLCQQDGDSMVKTGDNVSVLLDTGRVHMFGEDRTVI